MPRLSLRFNIFALGRQRGLLLGGIVYALTVAVDYLTPPELSVFPLYLFAVSIVSWNCGRKPGFAIAALCLFALVGLNALEGTKSSSPIFFVLLNANRVTVLVAVVLLTSQLRRLYDREGMTARIDYLTNVRNRKGFEEMLDKEVARHQRHRSTFCVAYLDCDDFKVINDKFGHAEGDRLLIAIANVASATLRRSDTIGRIGGDEFGILLPETDDVDAMHTLTNLRRVLDTSPSCQRHPVTFSVGVATFVTAPDSAQAGMAFADALMYRAKKMGKNQVVVAKYNDPMAGTPEANIIDLSQRRVI